MREPTWKQCPLMEHGRDRWAREHHLLLVLQVLGPAHFEAGGSRAAEHRQRDAVGHQAGALILLRLQQGLSSLCSGQVPCRAAQDCDQYRAVSGINTQFPVSSCLPSSAPCTVAWHQAPGWSGAAGPGAWAWPRGPHQTQWARWGSGCR